MSVLLSLDVSEPKGIQTRDGSGSHCQHVPDDSPHAGGGTLIGFHRGGVIVALYLEGDSESGSDGNDPCVFQALLLRGFLIAGEIAKHLLAGFITAMLAPEDREHAQFCQGGLAAQPLPDGVEFLFRKPHFAIEVGSGNGQRHREALYLMEGVALLGFEA
jgi:hypothetical protein